MKEQGMRGFRRTHGVLWLLLVLGGCAATRVNTDANAAISLAVCNTYQWSAESASDPTASRAFANPVNDQRLRMAVAKRLAAHGIQPVADGRTADCLVSHAIGTRESLDHDRRGPRFSFGIGTGWGGYYGRGTAGSVFVDSSEAYPYREGRIAVDIYRSGNREALWHASAEVDVSRLTGADAEQRIDQVVSAIFDKFPVVTH
jgi:hypothetical protein